MGIKNVVFDKVILKDIYGNNILKLSGEYNASTLAEYLISQWVGYEECHHCSRGSSDAWVTIFIRFP